MMLAGQDSLVYLASLDLKAIAATPAFAARRAIRVRLDDLASLAAMEWMDHQDCLAKMVFLVCPVSQA